MKKTTAVVYGIAVFGALAVGLATAGTSRAGNRIQVVYREQANGEWQAFIFGASCTDPKRNAQVVFPKDSTGPIEVECDVLPGHEGVNRHRQEAQPDAKPQPQASAADTASDDGQDDDTPSRVVVKPRKAQ
jgi:hypothetical protein